MLSALGIIWGMWVGKVPILLGINLIISMAIAMFLVYRKFPVWFTIGVVAAASSIVNQIWSMSVGDVSISIGALWIFVMILVVTIFRIVMSISVMYETISLNLNHIDQIFKGLTETFIETDRLNRIEHTRIVDLISNVIHRMEAERTYSSSLIEELDEFRTELNKNIEKSDRTREELNNFKEELSKTIKIPKWVPKRSK